MTKPAKILLINLKKDSSQELKNLQQDETFLEKIILDILDLTEKLARKVEASRKTTNIDMIKLKEEIALNGIEQYSLTFEPIYQRILDAKYSRRQELFALDKEDFIEIELAMLRKSMLEAHAFSIKLMETAGPRLDKLMNKLANEFGKEGVDTQESENDTGCKIYPLNPDIDGMTKN